VLRGCFVTATDTGVGKTILAGALVASLRARGEAVRARKPVITGVDDDDRAAPHDHELLAALSGERPETVSPARYGPAVSPHSPPSSPRRDRRRGAAQRRSRSRAGDRRGDRRAARPAGRELGRAPARPRARARRGGRGRVQGLERSTTRCSRSRRRDRPDSTCARSLMTPWPADPAYSSAPNRATIERLGDVEVATLADGARAQCRSAGERRRLRCPMTPGLRERHGVAAAATALR